MDRSRQSCPWPDRRRALPRHAGDVPCRKGARNGTFPLDLYRYRETGKNHNEGSRNRLVETMIELSDFDTITTSKQLL